MWHKWILSWNQGTGRRVSEEFECFLQTECVCVHVCVCLEGLICGELIAQALIMWPLAVMECDSTVLCSGSLSFQPAKPIKHTLPCFALHHSLLSLLLFIHHLPLAHPIITNFPIRTLPTAPSLCSFTCYAMWFILSVIYLLVFILVHIPRSFLTFMASRSFFFLVFF